MNSTFSDYLDTLNGLLTANQVCELLGIHHDTLYRWVRDQEQELPAINIGKTKPVLRFAPKDLAVWVSQTTHIFHGPSRFITDWMAEQVLRRGGPCFLPPLAPKVLKLTGYEWMATAQRVALDPRYARCSSELMTDFQESVEKLSVKEQRELMSQIKTGKYDEPIFYDVSEDELE